MRKETAAALVALALAATPAVALEPGDLVVGVGGSVYAVDPENGSLEPLFVGPDPGFVGGIAVGSGGEVFFGLTTFEVSGIWRLDPDGSLTQLAALRQAFIEWPLTGPAIALNAAGDLLTSSVSVLEGDGFTVLLPEIVRIDIETGTTTLVARPPFRFPTGLAVDAEGRILVSDPGGVDRFDPRTEEWEYVASITGAGGVVVETDGSILVPALGPFPPPPIAIRSRVIRIDPGTGSAEVFSESGLLGRPTGIALEADGQIIVASQKIPSRLGRLVRVDPDAGTQSLVVDDLDAAGAIAVVPPPEAAIDVRPSHIRLGPGSGRMIRVVLSGSALFDVERVEQGSLAFGPGGAAPHRSRVLRRGRDGYADLLLLFRADESGLAPGDSEACLTGRVGGFDFNACDDVVVQGPSGAPTRDSGPPDQTRSIPSEGTPSAGRARNRTSPLSSSRTPTGTPSRHSDSPTLIDHTDVEVRTSSGWSEAETRRNGVGPPRPAGPRYFDADDFAEPDLGSR